MEKEIKNDKKCNNCRYYLQHYIKDKIRYQTVCCGHCINLNNKNRQKKRPLEVCELWEDIAMRKEERKKTIKDNLEFMSERLNEIAMILKDDKE